MSIEIRTKRCCPPPFTSTSTSSKPSDSATRCAISSILDATDSAIVPDVQKPTKKWAFAHWVGSTLHNYCTGFGAGRERYSFVANSSALVVAVSRLPEPVEKLFHRFFQRGVRRGKIHVIFVSPLAFVTRFLDGQPHATTKLGTNLSHLAVVPLRGLFLPRVKLGPKLSL